MFNVFFHLDSNSFNIFSDMLYKYVSFFICKFNLLGAPYAKKSNVKQGKSITNYAPTHD